MNAEANRTPVKPTQTRRYHFEVCQVVQEFGRGFVEASSMDEAKALIEAVIEDSFEDINWYGSDVLEQIVGADIHDESGIFLEEMAL